MKLAWGKVRLLIEEAEQQGDLRQDVSQVSKRMKGAANLFQKIDNRQELEELLGQVLSSVNQKIPPTEIRQALTRAIRSIKVQ